MPSDSKFTKDEDGNTAVRVVVGKEALPASDKDWMFARDENGNIAVRVVNGAGSGGDSHNKGYYATQAALEEAYPTAEAGDWAIVGATDTVWVWDEDGSAWVDTDTKGEVTPDMIIVKSATMPTASTTPASAVYQYVGATNATYTHGYIYENVPETQTQTLIIFDPVGTGKLSFNYTGHSVLDLFERVASLSTPTFDPADVASGSFVLDKTNELWYVSGYDSSNNALFTNFTVSATGDEYSLDAYGYVYTFMFPDDYEDGHTENFTIAQESQTTYSWQRIDVQPAGTTYTAGNGIDITSGVISVAEPTLQNATDYSTTYSIVIKGNAQNNPIAAVGIGYLASVNGANAVAIGQQANSGRDSVCIGASTYSNVRYSIAIGHQSSVVYGTADGWNGIFGIAIGEKARVYQRCGIAIGERAEANADCAIQIGSAGEYSGYTNSDANTFKVGNTNGNFEIMSADGTVPTARLTKVNTTATLAVADWSSNTQTVSITGITADGVVMVSPTPANQSAYTDAGILCTAQAAGSLTFTCDTVPGADITVTVVML